MKLFLLFPALVASHMAWSPHVQPMNLQSIPEPPQRPSRPMLNLQTQPTPAPSRPLPTTISTVSATHAWDPLISSASHLLDDLIHLDLRKRQGGVGATNAIAVITQPVQMPAVTLYDMKSGPVRTYTQLFSTPLVPFPAPLAGSVGMGTIQGAIGIVKTVSKRTVETATPGQVLTIRGRGVTMV